MQPNSFTFVGLLNTCASMVALEEGFKCRCAHEQIIHRGLEVGCFCGGVVLVDMHAQCGSMEDAWSE